MPERSFGNQKSAPVLLTGYNRPELIRNLYKLVSCVRSRIYIHIDGPRDKSDYLALETQLMAKKLYQQARSTDVELSIKVLESNLGCQRSISSAIDWVLSENDAVIVIEDDVMPTSAFFDLMDICLDKFKYDSRIFQINGFAPVHKRSDAPPIFLSRHALGWGWATWKDRWAKANIGLDGLNIPEVLERSIKRLEFDTNRLFFNVWESRLMSCASGANDTWDYPWYLSIWMNDGWSLAVSKPLTNNIGFDERATRTHKLPNFVTPATLLESTSLETLREIEDYLRKSAPSQSRATDFEFDRMFIGFRTKKGLLSWLYNFPKRLRKYLIRMTRKTW